LPRDAPAARWTRTQVRSHRREDRDGRRRRLLGTAAAVVAVAGAGLFVGMSADTSPEGGIRLLQFNMCGHACRYASRDKVAGVVDLLADVHPAAASLNEVCRSQLASIVAGVADRQWAMHARFLVTQPDECTGHADYGNALLTRSLVTHTDAVNYAAQALGNPEHRGLLCVAADLAGRHTHICTTHIADSLDDPIGDVRRTQIAAAARRAGSYDGPAVLMGDFNAQPSDSEMSVVYTRRHGGGGHGKFDEIGQSSAVCRCGNATTGGSGAKYDYIFVSPAYFTVLDEDVRAQRFSDHKALLGWVRAR
jgi:endonuclease/exonuclease/phosphatase family metal-dependent hydrolase